MGVAVLNACDRVAQEEELERLKAQRQEDHLRQIRYAMFATGKYKLERIFPEIFKDDSEAVEYDGTQQIETDEQGLAVNGDVIFDIKYVSPSELEREKLNRALANARGSDTVTTPMVDVPKQDPEEDPLEAARRAMQAARTQALDGADDGINDPWQVV